MNPKGATYENNRSSQLQRRVGKTTTVINLAYDLSAMGKRVLIVDADPQLNTTNQFDRVGKTPRKSLLDIFSGTKAARCIYRTKYPNLDLIRGSRELETLSGPEISAAAIKKALEQVSDRYDYAVIDCHPSMQLPTIAALIAADELLIPCNADAFGQEGLDNMIGYLQQIKEHYNASLQFHVLITMYTNTRLQQKQLAYLAGHRRWRASQILVKHGYQKFASLPCLAIECDDVTAEIILIFTNSSFRHGDASGYAQMMEAVRLQELIPKMKGNEDLKGRVLRREVALSVKRSESTVQNLMFTYKHLSDVGMKAYMEEKLTPASALYLAKQTPEDQEKLVRLELLTVPAMEGYLAAQRKKEKAPELPPVSIPETHAQPYGKECTTGFSLTGTCEAAGRCEAPDDCCITCRKECPNRCGWITETMPEKLPEPAGTPEKTPAPVKKTSDPAAPGRAAAARLPEEPEPQLSANRSGQEEGIRFLNAEHHKFYSDTLQKFPDPAAPEKALCYCLGIHPAIREHVDHIYDFSTGQVTPECMQEGWVMSAEDIRTVIRMAYNLYGGTPSVEEADDQLGECRKYTVGELFHCRYAPYFWEAIKIRYPEYTE